MSMRRYLRLASSLIALAGSIILHSLGASYVVYAQTQEPVDDIRMQVHDEGRDIADIKKAIEQINTHISADDARLDKHDRIIVVACATGSIVAGFVSLLNFLGFVISPKPPPPPRTETA